ncbi:MAG: hypothetical protein ABSB29_03780 [Nitrososphaerales archaeon]|jgi:hypothetical protein
MKASELTIVSYCDFCPQARRKAVETCSACGKDLCEEHRFPLPVPNKNIKQVIRKGENYTGATALRLSFSYEFMAVCPECSSGNTVSKLVLALLQKQSIVRGQKIG